MSREQSFMNVLDAAAKVQWNVAMILEAKAVEVEKARNWIINHVHGGASKATRRCCRNRSIFMNSWLK